MQKRASRLATLMIAFLTLGAVVTLAPAQATGDTTAWEMEGCHGLATLALAPRDRVQASLPAGYQAQNAATFLLPGSVDTPTLLGESLEGEKGYVGVELWKCDRIRIGDAEAYDAVYGSAAAVVEQPDGAPAANLYFYKYENFFSDRNLVAQSERLGAPARLVSSASIDTTLTGASGSLQLADGGRYGLTTTDLGDMGPGNFEEWHHGDKGVSHWFADFTVAPGKQGTGTLEAPGGSKVAEVMGSTSGDGLGIHTQSTFTGGIRLLR